MLLSGPILLATLTATTAMALTATTASDVCPLNADPCTVTSKVDVTPDAVLDFGTRAVAVSGSGQFNFAYHSGAILCGTFSATTSGPAIDANGASPSGGSDSGSVLLHARRRCSRASPGLACFDQADCQIGPCGTRRCSGRPSRTCTADEHCQLGTCTKRRCSGASAVVCSTNADCNLGSCPVQTTCAGRGHDPVACATNADCDHGQCSVGSGSISLNGSVVGNSVNPAYLELRAADSISISRNINLSGTSPDSDGGELLAEAVAGSLAVTGKIQATAGIYGTGGTIELAAGGDVTIDEEINVNGGDFDGGVIAIAAGRDLLVRRSLLANSVAGAGYGGEVDLQADRDLLVSSATPVNKTTIETNGNSSADGSSGDGGGQQYSSGRHLSLGENTRLLSRGSSPEGYGGEISLDSGEQLSMAGDVVARSDGGKGGGGVVEVFGVGAVTLASTVALDLSGGAEGGELVVAGDADLAIAGSANLSGRNAGSAGAASIDGLADVNFSGAWTMSGAAAGSLDVRACRITLASGAKLDHLAPQGPNRLTAYESMKLLATSSLKAGSGGTNTLVVRSAAKPPLIAGTVSPAATLVVDQSLVGCSVCGNLEVDQGESCDDGNLTNGDGCSATCQNEKCLAQTAAPGYPSVPLCSDGDPCTIDTCDPDFGGGICRHVIANCSFCGDGVVDDDEECDDGNATFSPGEDCGVGCKRIPCGRPTNSAGDTPKTSDALFTLRAAVGQTTCSLRVCDVDGSGKVHAADAQRVLRAAVGQSVVLNCP